MKHLYRLKIREATVDDNDDLLALLRNCPMKDGFEFYIDRSPDFFNLYKIQNCDYKVFLCEKNKKVVGVIGSIAKDVYIHNKKEQVLLIGDLYILPEYRKGRILPKLMKEIINQNKDKYSLAMSTYEEENYNSIATAEGRLGFPRGEMLCEYNLYSLIPLLKIKTNKDYEFRNAEESDIPELVNLYNEYYKDFDFAPQYSVQSLSHIIKDTPGLSISDFKVCIYKNEIVSVSALWETSSIQKFVIIKFNFIYRILSFLIWLLSLIPGYKGKKFKCNSPIKFLWHCFNAYKNNEDEYFLQLLYNINNEVRTSDYLLTFISFDCNDKINSQMKKIIKTTIKHKVFFFSIRDGKGADYFINNKKYKFLDYTFGI